MKKLICLLLCLCLFAGFGSALAAPGRDSSGEPREESSGESSRGPSEEPSGETEEIASEEPSEPAGEETALDLNFNGIRVADMGVDVSTDGQGTYRFSLKTLLNLLGLEMSMDENDGSLVVRDKFGILGALLDG